LAYLSIQAVERIVGAARPRRGKYSREPHIPQLRRELERAAETALAISRRHPTRKQVEEALVDMRRAVGTLRRTANPAPDERALSGAWGLIGGALADRAASSARRRHNRLVVARASTLYARRLQRRTQAALDELDRAAEAAMRRLGDYTVFHALRPARGPASKEWVHFLIYRAREIFFEATGLPGASNPSGPCGRFTIALFRELREHLPGRYELTETAYRESAQKFRRL
jgi:hypothetical protein